MIETHDLCRFYDAGETSVKAVTQINLSIEEGEFVAIMGPSGSGKSTFMHILGCLDRPTSGIYLLRGADVSKSSDVKLAEIRNQLIGFVFQTYNLLPHANALKNVELPLLYKNGSYSKCAAHEALIAVGMQTRMLHKPNQLSGGQQQRVAIARALVNNPSIILADEPTGNLDSKTGEDILAIFQKLNAEGKTIILVTHERDVAEHTNRIIHFADGSIVDDEIVQSPKDSNGILRD